MRWKKWLENWDMTSLKINVHFLEMEWQPKDEDKNAAWELRSFLDNWQLIPDVEWQPELEDALQQSTTVAADLRHDSMGWEKSQSPEHTRLAFAENLAGLRSNNTCQSQFAFH